LVRFPLPFPYSREVIRDSQRKIGARTCRLTWRRKYSPHGTFHHDMSVRLSVDILQKQQPTGPPHTWGSLAICQSEKQENMARKDFTKEEAAAAILASSAEDDGASERRGATCSQKRSTWRRVSVFTKLYVSVPCMLRVRFTVPVTCSRCWRVMYFTERIHQPLQSHLHPHLPGQQRGLVPRRTTVWHDVFMSF